MYVPFQPFNKFTSRRLAKDLHITTVIKAHFDIKLVTNVRYDQMTNTCVCTYVHQISRIFIKEEGGCCTLSKQAMTVSSQFSLAIVFCRERNNWFRCCLLDTADTI